MGRAAEMPARGATIPPVAASVRASGDRAVAVIPEGPYVLPVCAEA
jgi:hypothetical protein